MNLQELNKELERIRKELTQAIPEASQLNYTMEMKKANLYMREDTIAFGNQVLRDAHVLGLLDQEGLVKQVEDQNVKLRTLYVEKELLIEMSKNLREIGQEPVTKKK